PDRGGGADSASAAARAGAGGQRGAIGHRKALSGDIRPRMGSRTKYKSARVPSATPAGVDDGRPNGFRWSLASLGPPATLRVASGDVVIVAPPDSLRLDRRATVRVGSGDVEAALFAPVIVAPPDSLRLEPPARDEHHRSIH